jgi:hypothetical protein
VKLLGLTWSPANLGKLIFGWPDMHWLARIRVGWWQPRLGLGLELILPHNQLLLGGSAPTGAAPPYHDGVDWASGIGWIMLQPTCSWLLLAAPL